MSKFVYVASPYTKGDIAINVRKNIETCDILAEEGYTPFCPLLYHFWHFALPHEYEFWTTLGLAWVEKCDFLIRLPGESSGADAEVRRGEELGIPIYFSLSDFIKKEAP